MSRRQKSSNGQALVMVTLALLAMSGLIGLTVDVGWSYFLTKQAQSVADSAALAAVEEAQQRMGGQFSGFTCPTTPSKSTPYCYTGATQLECSSGNAKVATASNLYNGCLYAAKNGFSNAVNSQQYVWMQAYDSTTAPPGMTYCSSTVTTSCYDPKGVAYWVSVTTSVQNIPQLFSSVFGNTQGAIYATATAAVISEVVPGQLILSNTPGAAMDAGSGGSFKPVYGEDLDQSGGNSITVPGGVILSSICTGKGDPTGCSDFGTNSNGNLITPSIEIPVPGTTSGIGSPTPTVGGGPFTDPYSGVPQPPLVPFSSSVGTCGIPGGTINGGNGSNYLVLGPFQYYSQNSTPPYAANGNPITLSGNVAFDPNSTNCSSGSGGALAAQPSGSAANGAFSTFYFYGGLNVGGPTYFGPGEYALVGANASNAAAGVLLTFSASNVWGSGTGCSASACTGTGVNPVATPPSGNGVTNDTGAGTLFVMTNPSYSTGLGVVSTSIPLNVTTLVPNLGTLSMQAGNSSGISLAGLDRSVASVPSALDQYNGLLLWQDRADSNMEYDSLGNITLPAGCPGTTTTACNPNTPTPDSLNAETITLQAHPNLNLAGVIYQPQGASIKSTGSGDITGAIQIITGGISLHGGGGITLTSVLNSAIEYRVALIH